MMKSGEILFKSRCKVKSSLSENVTYNPYHLNYYPNLYFGPTQTAHSLC